MFLRGRDGRLPVCGCVCCVQFCVDAAPVLLEGLHKGVRINFVVGADLSMKLIGSEDLAGFSGGSVEVKSDHVVV